MSKEANNGVTAMFVSPYLRRPSRSYEQYLRDQIDPHSHPRRADLKIGCGIGRCGRLGENDVEP